MAALDDTRIMTKSSGTPGEVPTQGDLYVGELAVNLADRKIYTRNVGGQIIELGGATGPELPNYDPLFQIVAVDTTVTGLYGLSFPRTLQVPPEVQAGDTALVFVYMRSDLADTVETIGITQSQLTPLLAQQVYDSQEGSTSTVAYRSWYGEVDSALIASGIEITSDNPTPDFWYTIYYIRNGEIIVSSATAQDTTATTQASPSDGAAVTGESVLPGRVAFVAAQNLYAYSDNSGIRLYEEDADITAIRGPLFSEGVQRLNTAYIISEGDFDHKIGALNSSSTAATLTDGFHVMRVDVQGKSTAVTSVNGQTGIVSLGIQDMDDFELIVQEGSTPATWFSTWTISTLANNQCMQDGQIGPGSDNGAGANFAVIDGDGNNRGDLIQDLGNGSLWFNVNNGAWNEATTGFISQACSPATKVMACPDLNAAILAAQIGDTIRIADGTPPDLVSYVPLSEGDVLQWNDADQKFNPAAPTSLFTEVDGGTFGSG